MDLFNNKRHEPKLLGQGEAKVLAVKDDSTRNHYVKVYHPDFGETDFIPFIQSPGLYRVPRVGDICIVFCKENFFEYPAAWGHAISTKLAKQLIGDRKDNITILYSSGEGNDSVTHKVELDDGDDKAIRVLSLAGHKILVNDTKSTIEVLHKDGAKITQSSTQIILEIAGTSIIMDAEGIKMKSAKGGTVDVLDKVEAKSSLGSNIKLNHSVRVNATDKLATVDRCIVDIHNHIEGNLGYPTEKGPTLQGTKD